MVVSCQICGKQFESFRGLNGHMNAHIPSHLKRAEELCDNCSGAGATIAGCTCGYMDYLKNAETFEAKEEIYVFRDNLNTGYVGKPSQFKTKYGSSDVKELKQIIKQKDDLERVPSLINFELKPETIKRVISRKTPMPVDFNWTHQWNAETISGDPWDEGSVADEVYKLLQTHGKIDYWSYRKDDGYLHFDIILDPLQTELGDFAAEEGQLAKALAAVREKSKRYAPTPLRLTKLPHPDQKTLYDKYEADEWKLLPRDSLGRWQKPVRSESINQLRESLQTSVPAISELLDMYGGDTPDNRYKIYNDLQSLKIDAMEAALPDDTTASFDMDDMSWMTLPEYYEHVLEEPLDISDDIEDDSTTFEFQERLVRYTAMTMLPQEVEYLIKENTAELTEDLFADNSEVESEINFLNAVRRYQKLSEQWSAE